jgi:hypothetical protein
MIPTPIDKLERFLAINHPMPAKRRAWAERDAYIAGCLVRLDGHLAQTRAAWFVAAHEVGRADPDPFFERTDDDR